MTFENLQKTIINFYSSPIQTIKDEHYVAEYSLGQKMALFIKQIEEKNNKKLTPEYEEFIMGVLSLYVKNNKTIMETRSNIREYYGGWGDPILKVRLAHKNIKFGNYSLAKFLFTVDLKILKEFFYKNKDFALTFLNNIEREDEVDSFILFNGSYLFNKILKEIPDNGLRINRELPNSLLSYYLTFNNEESFMKKIHVDDIKYLLDKASSSFEDVDYADIEKASAWLSLIFNKGEYNKTSNLEEHGFVCMFEAKSRYGGGYYREDQYASNDNFENLKEIKKKPFFIQLPPENNNSLSKVSQYKAILVFLEKMKSTNHQLVILVGDSNNVRKNESVILEKEIVDHLKWSISDSRTSRIKYVFALGMLKLMGTTATKLFKYKGLNEKEVSFERSVMEINFEGKLRGDYYKLLERVSAVQLEKIEEFLNENPEAIDPNTGDFTEEGLDLFEMNYAY